MSACHRRRQLERRRQPAVEGLEPKAPPSHVLPAGQVGHADCGRTTPSRPVPTKPSGPTLPPGDGTPPIAGPSVPGGTTEPG